MAATVVSCGAATQASAAGDDGSSAFARATMPFPVSASAVAPERFRSASTRSGGIPVSAGASPLRSAVAAIDSAQVRSSAIVTPFQANTGEFDGRVAFVAQTAAGSTFVTRDGRLVHSLPGPAVVTKASETARGVRARGRGWTLTETLVGARPLPQGGAASATHVSRFVGNDPSRWRSDVPTFDSVILGEAWPGVRAEIVARGRSVEKIFTVAPGADPRRIAVRVGGARRLSIAPDGALVAHTGNGPVAFSAPVAWQDVDGRRRPVRVAYAVEGHRYSFKLGSYDHALPLEIDPLLQATYLGGAADDKANALALDAYGNVYVAGSTLSTDFPGTTGGAQGAAPSGYAGPTDHVAFVARLSGDLTRLMQATYLGGGWNDEALALAVDAQGNVFVAGSVSYGNFPGTGNGAQPNAGGYVDAFVAKLSGNLAILRQATYLGGKGSDVAHAMSIDANGNVYVAGTTDSVDFPGTVGGAQAARKDFSDAFVARLDNALTVVVQSTYLGGRWDDRANALALDRNGNVFVAGMTQSPDLPGTAGGAQPGLIPGGADAFVARFNPGLTQLTGATFLGGISYDEAWAIALDKAGNVFVAGQTASQDFPGTAGSAQPIGFGPYDGFVARLNNGLTTLARSTYLGGRNYDAVRALAIEADGGVLAAGYTDSTDFPGVRNGAQSALVGGTKGFIARFDNTLATLTQSTYFGGTTSDLLLALAPHESGALYVAGETVSTNLPETRGAAQPAHGGGADFNRDAYVARLTSSLRLLDPPTPTAPVVEYYHAGLGHYFVTANPDEIAGLDAHVYPPVFGGNWERTTQSFNAYRSVSGRAVPACRFFSTFGAQSSHFYTADPLECAGLTARFANWQFENLAFYLPMPDVAGTCPSAMSPIYRMYNNGQGGAPNHRFTTDLATRNDFVANRGWVSEGAGPAGVAMCSPQAAAAGTAEGIWIGATATQSLLEAFVLDDGTYYFLYSLPNSANIGGMIQGHGTSIDGSFETTDAKDFRVGAGSAGSAALSADYLPRSSLAGDLSYAFGNTSFTSTYQAVYEQPASLAAASGTYQGLAGTAAGVQPVTLTASPGGAISGSASGCTFSGTTTPRGSVNIFDFSITFDGGGCLFGTSTLVGFAFYDAATGELLAFAPNVSRTDSILFVGTRP